MQCRTCKTIKNENDFDIREKGRRVTQCKTCRNSRMRLSYEKRKSAILERRKEQRILNPDQFREWSAKSYQKCKKRKSEYAKKYRSVEENKIKAKDRSYSWNKENPENVKEYRRKSSARVRLENRYSRAHQILFYAIRDKRIEKPEKCSVCQKQCKLHGHHHDYTKPLEVIWLCPQCHVNTHKQIKRML
jgi:hypothetical protein